MAKGSISLGKNDSNGVFPVSLYDRTMALFYELGMRSITLELGGCPLKIMNSCSLLLFPGR